MHKSTLALVFVAFIFSAVPVAQAAEMSSSSSSQKIVLETGNPAPVGELRQMLGMSEEEFQAEIAAGKTPMRIAEEHGMPQKTYLRRVKGARTVQTVEVNKKMPTKTVLAKKKVKVVKASVAPASHKITLKKK